MRTVPRREVHSRRLFTVGLGPLDHVDMPAIGALKQQDRGESVVEPGQLPGELHARPATTDQPRLWLVVHAISRALGFKAPAAPAVKREAEEDRGR